MLRRLVLEVIAEAVEGGGDAPAWHLLGRADPLVRPLARWRVRRVWEQALLDAPDAGGRRALLVAYLRAAGVHVDRAARPDALAAAYASARHRRPRRALRQTYLVTLTAVATALALLAWGAVAFARAIAPPPRADASRRVAPAPTGAYAHGGFPRPDAVIDDALANRLPEYLVVLDDWTRRGAPLALAPRVALAEARVLTPEVRAALGPRASARLRLVLARARRAATATPAPVAADAARRLYEAVGAFDDELAAADLGYYLDADVVIDRGDGGRHVILYAYSVMEVRRLRVDGAPLNALHLRRRDRLNAPQDAMGFARPHLRDALVQLDEVDESLVAVLLPALAEGSPMIIMDDDAYAMRSAWSRSVATAAGRVVREELGAALGEDAGPAVFMAVALQQRHELFARWRERLLADGIVLETPATLDVPARYETSLVGLVPDQELAQLVNLDALLDVDENARVLGVARGVVASSIARHEAQHRADYARPAPLGYPAALERVAGPLETRFGVERTSAVQARDELSAYLGELARDRVTPRTNLTLVARFVFDRDQWGGPEHHAALVILEGLREELRLGGEPIVKKGFVSRARAADLYLALLDVPPHELRAASARLWERLFEATLPEITEISPAR